MTLLDPKLELTFVEIETHYPDQWVVVEETIWDEDGEPIEGILIAYDSDRKALNEAIQKLHRQKPNAFISVYFTGQPIPDEMVFML